MSWTEEPSLAHPRAVPGTARCGPRIYAVGGTGLNAVTAASAEAYDPVSKVWSALPAMPTAREQLAAASTSGLLHAVGGFSDSYTALATHEVYAVATNSWTAAPPMPTARGALAAVTGSDGLVYAIGGSANDGTKLATVEAYDPVSNSWVTKAHMNAARMGLAAAATVDGFIYALGGIGAADAVNTVEVFNIAANHWSTSSQPLPQPIAWLNSATGPNGMIYVIGGMVKQADGSLPFLPIVYSFNPAAAANGWSKHAPVPTLRAGMGTATGPDGLVYAIGGINCPAQGLVGTVEAYAYDKCDYILYEMQQIAEQITALEESAPDLTPQQRMALAAEVARLRAGLGPLETALKICRGG